MHGLVLTVGEESETQTAKRLDRGVKWRHLQGSSALFGECWTKIDGWPGSEIIEFWMDDMPDPTDEKYDVVTECIVSAFEGLPNSLIRRLLIRATIKLIPPVGIFLAGMSNLFGSVILFLGGSVAAMYLGTAFTQSESGLLQLVGLVLSFLGLPGSIVVFISSFLLDFVTIPLFGYSVFLGRSM
ncbi:hypothetical protein AB0T83_18845 [Fluviibacterium sp. DFM31]|uniref:ABC transmembrane type-1 domain-containing protein n=2 Tax=Meridianimarinicoccus marinus TaxID=3231483 RepID=A0ABV3LBD7_9RHOB